jgi:hypothetical protein
LDGLTFFSSIIKSLAWPTAVIVPLFVFKRQLADLLAVLGNRLVTAKGVGFEFTFAERVQQIEDSLPALKTKEIASLLEVKKLENLSQLSKLPPPYIVLQAWSRLESAMQRLVGNFNFAGMASGMLIKLIGPNFGSYELAVFSGLRELRNYAAHYNNPKITLTEALRYNDLVDSLIGMIEKRHKEQDASSE